MEALAKVSLPALPAGLIAAHWCKGVRVWVSDPAQIWKSGEISDIDNGIIKVVCEDGKVRSGSRRSVPVGNPGPSLTHKHAGSSI
jgi:hypothetical protein